MSSAIAAVCATASSAPTTWARGSAPPPARATLLTAAVVDCESREHRDEVMEQVRSDPRMTEMADAEQVADMSQMRYGGFKTFVEA